MSVPELNIKGVKLHLICIIIGPFFQMSTFSYCSVKKDNLKLDSQIQTCTSTAMDYVLYMLNNKVGQFEKMGIFGSSLNVDFSTSLF